MGAASPLKSCIRRCSCVPAAPAKAPAHSTPGRHSSFQIWLEWIKLAGLLAPWSVLRQGIRLEEVFPNRLAIPAGQFTDPFECSSLVVAVRSALARLAPLASFGTSSMRSGFRFTTLGWGIFKRHFGDFYTGADSMGGHTPSAIAGAWGLSTWAGANLTRSA